MPFPRGGTPQESAETGGAAVFRRGFRLWRAGESMLDLKFIRQNPELVQNGARLKGEDVDIPKLLSLDETRRRLLQDVEAKRNFRNTASKEVNRLKKSGEDASEVISRVRGLSTELKDSERTLSTLEADIKAELLRVPNVPAADVPEGDPSANEHVRSWGREVQFDFEPKPHWDLAADLDILDFPRAAKLAGSNFALYKGLGARLARALVNFMLDFHTTRHGYVEVFPPFLATRECMTGTGQLPKLEDDMYRTVRDDLFLIPTAEVPVTNLHRDEVLPADALPLYYTAYTACFRREAGAYGRDTRGLLRVHQFNKVELVKFVRPEGSYDELEKLLGNAEAILQALGLSYRIVKLAAGDLSFAATKCYDIEAWAPGVKRYLEVSSCSNYEDFQARRANIRFRDGERKVRFVHTLNGSGLALPRVIVAIIESNQRPDGAVTVPAVLVPYMGGVEVIKPKA